MTDQRLKKLYHEYEDNIVREWKQLILVRSKIGRLNFFRLDLDLLKQGLVRFLMSSVIIVW